MTDSTSLSEAVTKVIKTGENQKLSSHDLSEMRREYLTDARNFNEQRKEDRQKSVDFMNRISF